MKKYYVWYATAKENDRGERHKSHAFDNFKKAQEWAREKLYDEKSNFEKIDFVFIDEVREYRGEEGNKCEEFIEMYAPHTNGWMRV